MGVNLTPIIEKKVVTLEKLRGKSFAVDAFVVLHQFLALVRTRDGLPLMNNSGEVTSHLLGLTLRTSSLISNYDMKFIFVFDGKPPELKNTELLKRKETKKRAENEYEKAILAKDYDAAFSKAVMTGHLTKQNIDDSKKLLSLMGVNWIQAPSEGEAQAAYMAKQNIVWACNSQDYDSLLYGTPRLVRYITIQGEEWLPSKNKARKLFPEIINLEDFLKKLEITREQLIDVGILIGTDYNNGIKGIGPKNAIKLIKTYGRLEKIPNEIRDNLPQNIDIIRNIYLKPEINKNYYLNKGEFNEDKLISFLCNKHNFSKKTVDIIINRIKKGKGKTDLNQWLV